MAEDHVDFAKIVKMAQEFSRPYRVTRGGKFKLSDIDPGDTAHLNREDKPRAQEALAIGRDAMSTLQDMLYAQDRWSVLLVFQAMDAAGKDGTIKHVMSGINPQGCQVTSFKAPTSEELDHDYMWRCMKNLPERGRIGIFNRSYYEEVLVVRVHPEILARQKLPPGKRGTGFWRERYQDINAFEEHLARNGTLIVKFFPNETGSPAGKLADAEIVFTTGELEGLKLTGFAIWERRNNGGRNVTFPARQYSVNGERRSFALLRPIIDQHAQDALRDAIIAAFAEFEAQQHLAMTG